MILTFSLQVVQNKGLSKTQKVRFFTPVVLANIATLYKWNGIMDVSTDEGKVRIIYNNEHILRLIIHS